MRKNIRIGDVLLEEGLISYDILEECLDKQKNIYQGKKKIGNILIEEGYITELQFVQALSKRLKIPFINLKNYPIDKEAACLLNEKIARKYLAVPINRKDKILTVAMSEPMNFYAIEEMKLLTKLEINPVISTEEEIRSIIERAYSGQKALSAALQLEKQYGISKKEENLRILQGDDLENAPIVKMINSILLQGVRLGASDIHIEAERDQTRVRMRIDGELQEQMQLNSNVHEAVITRLKIMANMDIAEKRLPQDGRIEIILENKQVEVRISTMPTINGEKAVIRILNTNSEILLTKNELGFVDEDFIKFEKMIKSPYGIVLVVGPTGSGKSTTLYTILSEMNRVEDNVITLEDPVEKKIDGINQIAINTKAGLTFASGLKAILRQDPNTIMIGEIRDEETANIAIRASITGHLVLSTLHTNDSISTIIRLVDMGIQPYLVSSAIVGVVAQRLTRVICPRCKMQYVSSIEENMLLEIEESVHLYRGLGCQSCNFTGYKGRMAVHEVLLLDSKVKRMISNECDIAEIKDYCKSTGMRFLKDNMKTLVLEGKSTIEEMIKITYNLD